VDKHPTSALSRPLDEQLDRQIERHRFPDGYRRLFHAAIEAFAERGFHATSTRDIAARAGMSPAAMYVHFTSKENVLHRIAVAALDLTVDVATAAAAISDVPAERLRSVVCSLTAWHAYHGAAVRVVLYQLDALRPEHQVDVFDRQRAINHLVRAIMTEGVARGEFEIPDIAATSIAALSMCVDTARWYRPDYRSTPQQIGDEYAAIALRMVNADPNTSRRPSGSDQRP